MITSINEFKTYLLNESYSVYKGINNTATNFVYGGISDDNIGEFYTDNIIMAKWFAGLTEFKNDKYVTIKNDGKVISKTIDIKNPYIIDSQDEDYDSVQVYFDEIEKNENSLNYRKHLLALGYDGIILKNCNTNYYNDGTYTIYIVFNKINESITNNNYVDLNTYDLKGLFNKINQECFGGELELCPIVVKPIKGSTAKFNAKVNPSKTPYLTYDERITISNLTHFTEEKLKIIMCHEMIHYWVASRYDLKDNHGIKFRENMRRVNSLGYAVTINDEDPGEINQDITVPKQLLITGTYAKEWKFYVLFSLTALKKLSQSEISRLLNDYVKNTKFENVKYYVTAAPEYKQLRTARELTKFTLLKPAYNYLIDNIVNSDKTRGIIMNDIYSLNESIINNTTVYEYIAYHSSNYKINEFDFDKIELKPNSSTRIDGIFFSDLPQTSWGEYIYKVKLSTKNPAIFDISKSRFDSLSIQEAFDALLRGDTSYIVEDLVEYGGMDESDAENLVEQWELTDLIVIKNCNYAKHNTEYIVPNPYYNQLSAKITILETKINESINNGINYNIKIEAEDEDGDRINVVLYNTNESDIIGKLTYETIWNGLDMIGLMDEDEYYKIFPDDEYIKIEHLEVKPKYANKGFAKIIMFEALKNIEKTKFNRIYLNASPMGMRIPLQELIEFYESFGFIVFNRQGRNAEMYKII